MSSTTPVTVRAIAFLDTYCKERGLPSTRRIEIPPTGVSATELAAMAGLPLERIEGVFHNYRTAGIDTHVMPGDRVAFVPFGTPASHPAFFGRFITRS